MDQEGTQPQQEGAGTVAEVLRQELQGLKQWTGVFYAPNTITHLVNKGVVFGAWCLTKISNASSVEPSPFTHTRRFFRPPPAIWFTAVESMLRLNIDRSRIAHVEAARDASGKEIKGAFSSLHKGMLAGHAVALKTIYNVEHPLQLQRLLATQSSTATTTPSAGGRPHDEELRLHREALVLLQLRHPNIVHFHGIIHDPDRHTLSFVLSWADNGSLYDYLHVHGNTLDLVTSLRVVAEVAAGMAYLHANNVVHRDLKSPNVLLDDALCARITDFGLSTFAHDHRKTLSKVAGTPHWVSPEQVLTKKLHANTDVFSFGVIVWEQHLPLQAMAPRRVCTRWGNNCGHWRCLQGPPVPVCGWRDQRACAERCAEAGAWWML